MAHVTIDRTDDGKFSVLVLTGIVGRKTKIFDTHAEAEAFAISKMGRRGMVIDNGNLTPEQRGALREHEARLRSLVRA